MPLKSRVGPVVNQLDHAVHVDLQVNRHCIISNSEARFRFHLRRESHGEFDSQYPSLHSSPNRLPVDVQGVKLPGLRAGKMSKESMPNFLQGLTRFATDDLGRFSEHYRRS